MQGLQCDLKLGDLTEEIIGIFYDVNNERGYGFLESIYQASLAIALREAGLRVDEQTFTPVWFRNRKVGEFRADMLIGHSVLLE